LEIRGWSDVLDAGIVHHDIEPRERLQDLVDHLVDGVRLRHIGGGIFHPDIDSDTICACAAAMSSGSLPVENDRGAGAASARAMPRPIPLVEPVTRGQLPGERAPARNVALRHRNIHGQLAPLSGKPAGLVPVTGLCRKPAMI
jgi:hypothetical protein